MMRLLIFTSLLFTCISFINGQPGTTVDYEDNFGALTLNYNGLHNGKHSYTETGSGDDVTVTWETTWWEINCCSGELLFTSVIPTSMNPPNLSIGLWQDADLERVWKLKNKKRRPVLIL